MITAFSIGDDIRTVVSAKIDKIEICKNPDGTPNVKYGVKFDYPNGFGSYQWVDEEDILKLIEKEESEDESET